MSNPTEQKSKCDIVIAIGQTTSLFLLVYILLALLGFISLTVLGYMTLLYHSLPLAVLLIFFSAIGAAEILVVYILILIVTSIWSTFARCCDDSQERLKLISSSYEVEDV